MTWFSLLTISTLFLLSAITPAGCWNCTCPSPHHLLLAIPLCIKHLNMFIVYVNVPNDFVFTCDGDPTWSGMQCSVSSTRETGRRLLQQAHTLLSCSMHQLTCTLQPPTTCMTPVYHLQPRPTTYNLIKNSSHLSNHHQHTHTHTCMVNLHTHITTQLASIKHHQTEDSHGNWPSSRGSTNRSFHWTTAIGPHKAHNHIQYILFLRKFFCC